jgi:hypothetical protein
MPVRFVLVLEPTRGVDAVKALRWVLKKAGRLGLKCVELHEQQPNSRAERENAPDVSPAIKQDQGGPARHDNQ